MKLFILLLLFFTPHKYLSAKTNIEKRRSDWRFHQIIYQIFPDRFYNGDKRRDQNLNRPPRLLKRWKEKPRQGKYLSQVGYWSHELEFWGGDLRGIIKKIDYIKSLGVNTIYLNPIFKSYTNHKYGTSDYFKIDEGLGNSSDLKELGKSLKKKGMHLILDGVFNHMGMESPWFQKARKNPKSPYRDFFKFDKKYKNGYGSWYNVKNLPELQIEKKKVQERIFLASDSVVKKYLEFADGWRLDVANNLGPAIAQKITNSAHKEKKDSLVIGECWNYPDKWIPSLDGVMNFYLRELILALSRNKITARKFNNLVEEMIEDTGIEGILRSWNILSNHDTERIKTMLPDEKIRKLALFLQFILPGSPVLYYGEEIGMEGGRDPENRGAMNWNRSPEKNNFILKMISLRNQNPAIQFGNYRKIESENMISFTRTTEKIRDFVVALANPTKKKQREFLAIPEYRLMSNHKMKDLISGKEITIYASTIEVELKPKEFALFVPLFPKNEFSGYKRVK